jgi:hypothetical protein
MAKLNAAARKKIKSSKFGIPPKDGKPGKYPMEDRGHAIDAEARATEELAKGHLSPEQAAHIRHEAKHVLGEADSHYHNK